MAFDFPSNPAVGDKFTDPATNVTYQWDGEKWVRV
jgi:hypothetical protein